MHTQLERAPLTSAQHTAHMVHTHRQERCSLALSLQSRVQHDDFGGFVEPSMKMLLAAGMARIAHKDSVSERSEKEASKNFETHVCEILVFLRAAKMMY